MPSNIWAYTCEDVTESLIDTFPTIFVLPVLYDLKTLVHVPDTDTGVVPFKVAVASFKLKFWSNPCIKISWLSPLSVDTISIDVPVSFGKGYGLDPSHIVSGLVDETLWLTFGLLPNLWTNSFALFKI